MEAGSALGVCRSPLQTVSLSVHFSICTVNVTAARCFELHNRSESPQYKQATGSALMAVPQPAPLQGAAADGWALEESFIDLCIASERVGSWLDTIRGCRNQTR